MYFFQARLTHFELKTLSSVATTGFRGLVVLHAAPFPTDVFRRFDLNKYRSMLVARVKTGTSWGFLEVGHIRGWNHSKLKIIGTFSKGKDL